MSITNNRIDNGNFKYDIDTIPVCKQLKATNGYSNSEKIPAAHGVRLHLPSKHII